MFVLEDCVAYIATNAMKKITSAFNEVLKKNGSTRVQWTAMYYIAEHEGINQSTLAGLMNLQTSTVVRLLDRLEREGLVERYANPDDRRTMLLRCTKRGYEINKKMLPVGDIFASEITDGISPKEIESFFSTLEKLVKNTEKINLN